MKKQLQLNIKTACSEKFDQFSPTTQGGFCGSCEKEVIDFTNMKAHEVAHYFQHNASQNTCGRFNSTQLQPFQQKRTTMGFLSGIGLACLSLFSMVTGHAQEANTPTDTGEKKPLAIKASQFENDIVVKGHVTDGVTPLPGANILLQGTTTGTTTNFDGDFEFPRTLKKGDVLIFSYLGFTSQKVVITNEDAALAIALEVNMKMDACIIMGKVAVKEVYSSKKN